MKYFKVKPEYDNEPMYFGDMVLSIYVMNELYTQDEIDEYGLNIDYMEPVEIPEEDTYWFFGCRFN